MVIPLEADWSEDEFGYTYFMIDYNDEKMKREVYCKYCKEQFTTNKPAPLCPRCGHQMITAIKSNERSK